MPDPSLVVAFRTHLWDAAIAVLARRLAYYAQGLSFVVLADETHGPLETGHFTKLVHDSDFSDLGLPNYPANQVLWYNADYPLYLLRQEFPEATHFAMVEYDVAVNTDVTVILRDAQSRSIDFIAVQEDPEEAWYWRTTITPHFARPKRCFMPFAVVSARAIDAMLARRQAAFKARPPERHEDWPFCEGFMPSVVAEMPDGTLGELSAYARLPLFHYRFEQHVHDPEMNQEGTICHPVLGDERLVKRRFIYEPPAAILDPESGFHRQIQFCDPRIIAPLLEGHIRATGTPEMARRYVALAASRNWPAPGTALMELAARPPNLARGRPALMSSIWKGLPAQDLARAAAAGNDGRITGAAAFHTEFEAEPWWQVDLEGPHAITHVRLFNRMGFQERCTRVSILVSMTGVEFTLAAAKLDAALFGGVDGHPYVFEFDPPVPARFVRVALIGEGILHLDEIEVYGEPAAA